MPHITTNIKQRSFFDFFYVWSDPRIPYVPDHRSRYSSLYCSTTWYEKKFRSKIKEGISHWQKKEMFIFRAKMLKLLFWVSWLLAWLSQIHSSTQLHKKNLHTLLSQLSTFIYINSNTTTYFHLYFVLLRTAELLYSLLNWMTIMNSGDVLTSYPKH